jgi:hypothetical protein
MMTNCIQPPGSLLTFSIKVLVPNQASLVLLIIM